MDIRLIPHSEFVRVRSAEIDKYSRLQIIADMCRANTLAMVKRAGSGHLGTSFSAMDIVVYLYHEVLNTLAAGLQNPNRDIYFSSKGHDVPGLYSVLFSFGVIPLERYLKLRRLGGLDGHPDIKVPGVESNSGSLGMGISKAKGMALAKRMTGTGGDVFVLTGDGELQEGQIFESLQTVAHQRVDNLVVLIDHNKVQSDKPVSEIVDLRDLPLKLSSFGWCVERCDGHSFTDIAEKVGRLRKVKAPKILILDTIKGRGVSFMEHPFALAASKGLYPWHAGAPDDDTYLRAHRELVDRVQTMAGDCGLDEIRLEAVPSPEQVGKPKEHLVGEPVSQAQPITRPTVTTEYVAQAYGEALVELAGTRPDLVVLDADLASDCKIRRFENTYPERFIENGIAEQDMVSTAGGLARMGLLPVVNSFAAFLASRANEQIYTNATENTKIIYALHYAGLIPAGPGKSHQSVRDISLLGAIPNMTLLQPCNGVETRQVVEYCVQDATENCAIRLVIGPSPRTILLPDAYRLTYGRGVVLRDGGDAALFAYGPVMMHEALLASEILESRGVGLRVINMPWLNRFDAEWLDSVVSDCRVIFVLEDHSPVGGLGDRLLEALTAQALAKHLRFVKFGVQEYPACGTPAEALTHHGLDGPSLARRVSEILGRQ